MLKTKSDRRFKDFAVHRAAGYAVETLERRVLLTTNAWLNPVSGDWNTASNWSLGHVPTSSEDVAITVAGTYTVTDNSNEEIRSLTLGGSGGTMTLSVSNNTLTLDAASSVMSSGVLNLNSSTISGTGTLTNVAGATLTLNNSTINAPLVNQGLLSVPPNSSGGSNSTVNGSFTAAAGSSITVTFDNSNFGYAGTTLTFALGFTNDGSINLIDNQTGGNGNDATLQDAGVITNAVDGTIIASGIGIRESTLNAAVVNAGNIIVSDKPGLFWNDAWNGDTAASGNTGTINVSGGSLTLYQYTGSNNIADTFTNTGVFSVASGQGLVVQSGTFNQSGGTLGGTGSTLTFNSGAVNFNTNFTTAAGTSFSASGSTINGPGTITNAAGQTLTLSSSTVNAPLVNQGVLSVPPNSGGSSNSAINGSFTAAAGSLITVLFDNTSYGYAGTTLTFAQGFTNNGTINLIDNQTGGNGNDAVLQDAGVITNAVDGTIIASGIGNRESTLNAPVINDGNITVSDSRGLYWDNAWNGDTAASDNTGTINVSGGSVTLNQNYNNVNDNFTNTGTFSVASGQSLLVQSGTFSQSGGTLGGAGSTLTFNSGAVNFNTNFTSAALYFGSETASFANSFSDAGTSFSASSSTINGPGTITNAAGQTLTLNNSTINAPLVNQGLLSVPPNSSGGSNSTVNGSFTAAAGSSITVTFDNSNFGYAGTTLTFALGFTNDGSINLIDNQTGGNGNDATLQDAGVITNAVDGTIIASGIGIRESTLNAAVVNAGNIIVSDKPGLFWNDAWNGDTAASGNTGTINVSGGSLTLYQYTGSNNIADTFTNTGVFSVASGQGLVVQSGTFNQSGGTLGGTGSTLTFNSGAVNFNTNFTTAAGTSFSASGSTINGPGTITNAAGQTLTLSSSTVNAPLVNQGVLSVPPNSGGSSNSAINGSFTAAAGSLITVLFDNTSYGYAGTTLTFAQGFTNNGTINLIDNQTGGNGNDAVLQDAGVITNAVDGTIIASGIGNRESTLNAPVINDGNITVSDSRGLYWDNAWNGDTAASDNTGTINVSGGSVTLNQNYNNVNDNFTNTGTFSVASGQSLLVQSGTFSQSGGTLGGAGSTLTFNSGAVNFNTNFTSAALYFGSETASFANSFSDAGTSFSASSSTINGPGTITNAAGQTLTLNNSTINAPLVNQGLLSVPPNSSGGSNSTVNGSFTAAAGSSITVTFDNSNFGYAGTTLTFALGFTNDGSINLIDNQTGGNGNDATLQDAGVITNAVDGTIIASGIGIRESTLNAAVVNAGSITVSDSRGLTINLQNRSLINTGAIEVSSGLTLDNGTLIENGAGFITSNPTASIFLNNSVTGTTTNSSLFALQGNTQFSGGSSGSPLLLEAMSADQGAVPAGFIDNFSYGTVSVAANSYLQLVDQSHNSTGTGSEAVYANTLIVGSGSTLNLNGLHIYVRSYQVTGTVTGGTVTLLAPGGELPVASPTPGAISTAGQVDTWTFYGRGGQAVSVFLNPGLSNPPAPLPPAMNWAQVDLLDPSNNVIATANNTGTGSGSLVSLLGVSLPMDGTYTIRIEAPSAQASASGSYMLTAYNSTVNANPLNLNQQQTGTIAGAFGVDNWSFSATAETQVKFNLVGASSSQLGFTLSGPNGYTAFTNATASSGLINLPNSGQYVLSVSAIDNQSTGSYAFNLQQTSQTALALGTPFSGTIAGSGQAQLFELPVPASNPMSVVLADPSTADHLELFAKFGAEPTLSDFDYSATGTVSGQSFLIPSATAGNWYILVYAESIASAPSTFTLKATSGEVLLFGSTPNQGVATLTTTLTINGAGFNSGSTVSLVSTNNTVYPATTSVTDLPTQMTATFAAGSVPAGTYSIRVTQADAFSTSLPSVLTMAATGTAVLTTHLELPNPTTRHIAQTYYIDYANTGNAAMPAPLLVLTATNPLGQQGALFTLNPALQGEGLWVNSTPVGYSQSVEILASGATPGILEPGESERVPVYYAGWLTSQWDFSQSYLNFSLEAIQANDSRPMNWEGVTYATGTETFVDPSFYDVNGYNPYFGFTAAVPWTNGIAPTNAQITQDLTSGAVTPDFGSNAYEAEWFVQDYQMLQLQNLESYQITATDNETGVAQSPPPSFSATAWNVITSNLEASVGNTLGNYVQALDNQASYLGQLGESVTSIPSLWGFEVEQADNSLNPLAPYISSVTDDSVATPGSLSLSFSRVFAKSISGRDTMGSLGMGWSSSWDTSATINADSSVTINEPGGGERIFEPDDRTAGAYFSQLGDTGTLSGDGSGGYLLTEADGTATDYTSTGLLNYMQDTDGNRITTGYTNGQLTSLTASTGQYINLAYNSVGLISSITDSDGRTATYGYDPSDTYLTSVTSYTGQVTQYSYNTIAGTAAQNALTSIALPGGTHQYFTYDSQGRLASTYSDGGAQPETFTYNIGQVSVTDGTNDTSNIFYNENDQVAKSVDPLGNPTYYTYDNSYNLKTVTDAAGQSELYTYNSAGEVTASTDFLGNTTQFSYGGPFNSLSFMTDANGNKTSYAYDSSGDLLSTTYANGTSSSSTFNPLGEATSFVNANGQPISYLYNTAGQVTKESFSDGSNYAYTYDTNGNLLTATDSTGTTTFTYAATTEFLTEIAYPNGTWLKFTYNTAGQRTQMVDQTGFTTNYTYDSDGRLSQLTDGSSNVIVTYTYDANGRLSEKVNGNGTYTTYQYDADGNVLHLINYAPGGAVNSRFDYTYNSLGLETTEATIDGTWTYGYDADGQLIHAVFTPNSSNPDGLTAQNLTYNYDAMGNRTSTVINGVTTAYTVNDINQYSSVGGVAYNYDADGNLISDGSSSYTYNSLNELTGINGPGGTNTYTYDAFSQEVASSSAGMTTWYLIDPVGLGNIVTTLGSQGNLLSHFTYGIGLAAQTTSTNRGFYDFDALGSTIGISNANGIYTFAAQYLPFGGNIASLGTISNNFEFVGQFGIVQTSDDLASMRFRPYSVGQGRFISQDPSGIAGGINLYRYGGNNPVQFVDPSGLSYSYGAGTNGSTRNNPLGNDDPEPPVYGPQPNPSPTPAAAPTPSPSNPPRIPTINYTPRPFHIIPNPVNGVVGELPSWSFIPAALADDQPSGPIFQQIPPPPVPPDDGPDQPTSTVNAQDPNAIYGPVGYSASNFIQGSDTNFGYLIDFENASTASAPAQEVTVTDQLDPSLNWSTFQLTGVGFGNIFISIPAGVQSYETTVSMTYLGQTFEVEVEAGVRSATGQVYAIFQSIDPLTGLPPSNPLIGFLPPEDGSGRGDGYLSYTVSPKANLATGTQIRSVADITFDQGLIIATDQISDSNPALGTDPTKMAQVTIDSNTPTSMVATLPATESSDSFTVDWSGQDGTGGSGIASYTIYVSTNGGSFVPWLINTNASSATFAGVSDSTYGFYSVATNNVGTVQPSPTTAQATTTISGSAPAPLVLSGSTLYLKLDVDGQHLDIWDSSSGTGTQAQSDLLSGISSITINGAAGGTNLTVDFSNGDPLISPGLTFNGSAGASNTLNVIGTSGNDTVTVNGTTVTESATFGSATLTYSNLSMITFDGGTGSDVLNQTAQPGGGASLSFVGTTANETLNVSAGTYTFAPSAAGSGVRQIALETLSIGSGAKVVLATSNGHNNRSVLVVNTLSLAGSAGNWTGTLDLSDNDVIIQSGTITTITNEIKSGYNGGNWQGIGLTSFTAANDSTHLTALGVLVNNNGIGSALYGGGTALGLFDGVNPAVNAILVKYTYYGDANLDGIVDGSDYTRIDNGGLNHLTGWSNGDFNYDGRVDGSDYTLIDNAYNTEGLRLNLQTAVLTLPAPPTLTYDGTSDVTSWVMPTLSGAAGSPAPTGTVTLEYFIGTTATGTMLPAPPQAPGTYTVIASYSGNSVYSPDLSNAVTFTINKAAATVTLAAGPSTIKYDGTTDVTNWVKGFAAGLSGAALATGSVTPIYYSGTSATGTPLGSSPINAGTYTVVGSYSGDSNYAASLSAPITFTISASTGSIPLTLTGPAFYLKLDSNGLNLDVWDSTGDSGTPTQSIPLSTVSSITVDGVAGGSTLSVDYSTGEPLVPSGLDFVGIGGSSNTLKVIDTDDAGAASFTVDATNVHVTVTSGTEPLSYANISTIDIFAGSGSDTLTQNAQPGGGASLAYLNTTASDSLTINAGTFTFTAAPAGSGINSEVLGNVAVAAGAKIIVAAPDTHSDRHVMVLSNLFIAGSTNAWQGQVDLSGNDLIVHNGNLSQITDQIASGYNAGSGYWDGLGISSSSASNDRADLTPLGVELNNNGGGQPLFGAGTALGLFDGLNPAMTDVLIKYTYYGDANLDGKVDGTDYSRIDNGNLNHLTGWSNGDFNYDGVINGSDYTLIDNAFNTQGAALAALMANTAAPASEIAEPVITTRHSSLAQSRIWKFGETKKPTGPATASSPTNVFQLQTPIALSCRT